MFEHVYNAFFRNLELHMWINIIKPTKLSKIFCKISIENYSTTWCCVKTIELFFPHNLLFSTKCNAPLFPRISTNKFAEFILECFHISLTRLLRPMSLYVLLSPMIWKYFFLRTFVFSRSKVHLPLFSW